MRSLTRRIYLLEFAVDFVPIYTLYSVMFAQKGLDTFEISVIIAAWSAACLVFEVPSGVLADRIDRRYVLVLSQLLPAAGLLLWLTFPTFWSFLIGFVLWGMGSACHSGTFEALLFDELKSRRREDDYLKVVGRTEAASLVAVFLSALVAAPLVKVGYDTVIFVSLTFALMAAGIPLLLPKAPPQREVEDEKYFVMLGRGIRDARLMPGFIRVLIVMAMIGCVADIVDEYGPLFVSDAGFAASGVALVGAVVVLISATVSALIGNVRLNVRWHPLILVAAGAGLLAGALTSGIVAVAAFGIAVVILQASWVLTSAHLQHTITGDLRATSTSLVGFARETANVIGLIGLGALADATGRPVMYTTLAAISLGLGIITFAVLSIRRPHPSTL